jgi:hypothetical protein
MSIKSFKKLQFSQLLADFVHSFQISTFNIPLLPALYIEPYTYYYVDPLKKLCEIKFNDRNQAMEHFTTQHLAKKELLIVQDYANQHVIALLRPSKVPLTKSRIGPSAIVPFHTVIEVFGHCINTYHIWMQLILLQ